MKKGFTLIELMAVIIILGILSIVIIPKIGDSITSSKNRAYEIQVESIKKGVYDFLIDNDVMRNTNNITLTLGVIKQGGYLPIEIKNPITKKSFSNESNINVTKTNEAYNIDLNLFDVENYNENINSNSPILVLNGNYVEYVDVFSEYQEQGATAIDYTGQSLAVGNPQYFLNETNKPSIETNTLNTYTAVYTVTDSEGNRSSATRTIIVRDNEAPTINVPENTTIAISQVANYDLKKDISVTDNFDNINISSVSTTSNLAGRAGKYVITYTVTDSSGNTTNIRRLITVDDTFDKFYTRVDYLKSTGTQYIMTDIKPNNNMGVYLKASRRDAGQDSVYFGSKDTLAFWVGSLGGGFYHNWNGYTYNGYTLIIDKPYEIKMNYLNSRNIYVDNILMKSNLQALANNNYPMTIFAGNVAGAVNYKSRISIYEMKISEGNQIIHDLIPCYRNDDKKPGLYDIINDKFYTNSGTGEFEIPEENNNDLKDDFSNYNQLMYIQSTYSQCIITDVVPNDNIGVYAKLSSQNINGDRVFFGSRKNDNRYYVGNNAGKIYFGWNYKPTGPEISSNNIYEIKFNYLNSRNSYLDNELIQSNLSTLLNNDLEIAIFCTNQNGGLNWNSSIKLYEFKISEGDKIIRDFVPCYRKSDGVAGLYDIINNKFYTNSVTTTEFIKGELED